MRGGGVARAITRRWLRSDEEKKKKEAPPEAAVGPLAFFKIMHGDFGNAMFIPPNFAPKLEDLTDQNVCLEDSDGNCSKVRLSVVDGSLAFQQGWSDFVSDHSIRAGEVLVFQYTGKSSFYVRVFGFSACEREHFRTERKRSRRKRKGSSSSVDEFHPPKRSQNSKEHDGNCCISAEDLKSKEPRNNLVAEASEINREILRVIANAEEDPKRTESERPLEFSAATCQKDAKDATESEGVHHQEVIANADAALTMLETNHALEFSTVEPHQENKNILKEYEAKAAIRSHHQEVHASADDAGNKQEKVILDHRDTSESNTSKNGCGAVDNRKLPMDGNVSVKSEPAEDLWKKNSTYSQSALGGSEEPKEADSDLMRTNDTPEKQASEIGNYHKFSSWIACTNQKDISFEAEDLTSLEVMVCDLLLKKEGTYNAEGIFQILDDNMVANLDAVRVNPVDQYLVIEDSEAHVKPISAIPHERTVSSDGIAEDLNGRPITNHSICGKGGATTELQHEKEHLEPVGSVGRSQKRMLSADTKNVDALEREKPAFREEHERCARCIDAPTLQPGKANPLEFEENPLLKKINFCFSIPSATATWLVLPKLPSSVRKQRKQDRRVVILKDPMKRAWPVLYHESICFTGFTVGWKPFVRANSLQRGDRCELFADTEEEEAVYHVSITKE